MYNLLCLYDRTLMKFRSARLMQQHHWFKFEVYTRYLYLMDNYNKIIFKYRSSDAWSRIINQVLWVRGVKLHRQTLLEHDLTLKMTFTTVAMKSSIPSSTRSSLIATNDRTYSCDNRCLFKWSDDVQINSAIIEWRQK